MYGKKSEAQLDTITMYPKTVITKLQHTIDGGTGMKFEPVDWESIRQISVDNVTLVLQGTGFLKLESGITMTYMKGWNATLGRYIVNDWRSRKNLDRYFIMTTQGNPGLKVLIRELRSDEYSKAGEWEDLKNHRLLHLNLGTTLDSPDKTVYAMVMKIAEAEEDLDDVTFLQMPMPIDKSAKADEFISALTEFEADEEDEQDERPAKKKPEEPQIQYAKIM